MQVALRKYRGGVAQWNHNRSLMNQDKSMFVRNAEPLGSQNDG